MCQLTVLARLLFDRALSCPGSLSECNFTSNVGLGRLHCLSDCVLSLCKSVCSYLVFASLTANASRIVGVCFLALSKPVSPIREALMLLARVAHSAWPFTLRRLWWRWRALPPRVTIISQSKFTLFTFRRLLFEILFCRFFKPKLV